MSTGQDRDRGAMLRCLGAMSGTSLDGVDAAVLDTDGHRIGGFGPSAYRAYDAAERATLHAALGHWDGPAVVAAADVVTKAHADLLSRFARPDLVGFHGQTLAHDPGGRGSLQVGDGAALAQALDCPVVWDFRSADIARGGQGAPLAPFFHFACAKWIGAQRPICLLNLGGVANITYIDPAQDRPEAPGALLAFDTGPANAPLDDLMRLRRGLEMDRDGALAFAGTADATVVARCLASGHLSRQPPKSMDRNDFAAILTEVSTLPDADALATLCAVAAGAVGQALRHLPHVPERILVTGCGRHNRALMRALGAATPCPVAPVEAVGLDGDMLEAQAFAFLAARVMRGLPISAPATTGVSGPCLGGRISPAPQDPDALRSAE